MKTYSIILSSLLLSLLLQSCQKFIDIKKNSNQFFMTTANDCQLLLDDYAKMNTGYPLDGEISADDYYISGTSYLVATLPQEEKDLYAWNPAAQRKSSIPNWLNPYQVVSNTNLVLETLDKLKGSNEDPVLLNTLRGTALFYRAYCFWTLAQLYAKPYQTATANQDPGIPLRMTPDINEKSTRGTVQDTYSRILQDLQEALSLLPNTSSIATRPNKIAAYAMLARTYLSMEDYPNALINANAVLAVKKDLLNYNNISKTLATPFTRFNTEVIFHTISSFKSSAPAAGLILAAGSAAFNTSKIDSKLVASYATDDLRKVIFLKENTMAASLDDPTAPTGKRTVTLADGTFRFTGNYEQVTTPTFFTGLAVDEMFLISAECYARAGNIAAAATNLNILLSTRWKTGTYVDMSPDTPASLALSKILDERRKELLMRGLRWTDLRRLNRDERFRKDLIRQTKNVSFSGTVLNPIRTETVTMTNTLPANDLRYTLLLPVEVIENTTLAQNSR